MAKLKIVEWPAKVLETKSELITEFDEELRQLVSDMHETMDHEKGIGLAANQIGHCKQIITIYIPFEANRYETEPKESSERFDWHDQRYTIINPRIKSRSGTIKWQEGCLSFPEIFENVDRAAEVVVEAQNEFGQTIELKGTGLFSVCLQHEIDHINGIVFFNRMSRLKSSMIKRKMLRRSKFGVEEE